MNLNEILRKHEMWLNNKKDGECANLRGADLRNVDFKNIKLRDADLSNANLSYADLRGADLKCANLYNANLKGANLIGADLKCSNLNNANLSYADLRGTDLKYANLYNIDLRYAILYDADLRYANLIDIKTNMYTIGFSLVCPEKGSFIGYKKVGAYIVELLILEDAKRSSATTMKCRCDKAKVLDIENILTGKKIKKVSSNYDSDFVYKIGEIVTVDNFDDNRWNECSTGIHFFMNRENAINY